MDQLKELSAKFENYLARVFPQFVELSIGSLRPLAEVKERMEMKRPLITSQTIDNSVQECLEQIETVNPKTELHEIGVVLDNAKNILILKQKVLESNSKNFSKFCSIKDVPFY